MLAGYGLRAFRLGHQSLWWDETYSVEVARHGPIAILGQARADPLPHFLALWAWMTGAGQSEYAVRYMSLLLGLLAIALCYRFVREFGSRRAAILAAALCAVSGLAVYYSQEARLHMLGLVLVLSADYALMVALRTSRTPAWITYGLLAAAALYSHYYAALALLGMNAPLLFREKTRREPGWLLANGAALLVFAPWAAVAYGRFGSSMSGQTTGNIAPGLGQFIADTSIFMLFGRTADWRISIGPAALAIAVLLAACWSVARKHGSRGLMLVGYAVVPVAGSYVLALALPGTYDVRYSVLALPAWLALLALGLMKTSNSGAWTRSSRFALPVLAIVFVVPTSWSLARNYAEPAVARDDYRAAFAEVRNQALPADVLIYDSPIQVSAVNYYFADAPVATASVPLDAGKAAIADQLAQLQRQHQGIWLLLALDQRHMVEQWLDAFATPVSNQWFGGGLRLKHYLPAARPLAEASLRGGQALHRDLGPLRLEQIVLPTELRGTSLPVELLWTVTQRPTADLTVSLQLLTPNGARLAQVDRRPLNGAVPTSQWQPGEAFVDELKLPLSSSSQLSGIYQVELSVYGQDGPPVSPAAVVATIPVSDNWKALPIRASSNAGWSIETVRVGDDSAGRLMVQEGISIQGTPSSDYTWFAHLLDAQGRLIAQDDHPPLAASHSWQAGEHVSMDFVLDAPRRARQKLELGAYAATGQRVEFTMADGSVRDALVADLD